ncbi:hypothetical protein DVA78_18510, partial [Acinetobacter baumannii]
DEEFLGFASSYEGDQSGPLVGAPVTSDRVPAGVLRLCPPDPRWLGAVWIRETGTRGLRPGPQHPPAQGAPQAKQQCQDHAGLGQTQLL